MSFSPDSLQTMDQLLHHIGKHLADLSPPEAHAALNTTEFFLLRHLLAQGPTHIGGLAQAFHLNQATISNAVHHLESRGLVTRSKDPKDRRITRVALTEKGQTRVQELLCRRERRLRRVLSHLSPDDQHQLLTILKRLLTGLELERDDLHA